MPGRLARWRAPARDRGRAGDPQGGGHPGGGRRGGFPLPARRQRLAGDLPPCIRIRPPRAHHARVLRGPRHLRKDGARPQPTGRRGLRAHAPWLRFPRAAAGSRTATQIGRVARAVRHLLHGVGHRRGRNRSRGANRRAQRHLPRAAAPGPRRAPAGRGERDAPVSARNGRNPAYGLHCARRNRKNHRIRAPAAPVPGRAGAAFGFHGRGNALQRGGRLAPRAAGVQLPRAFARAGGERALHAGGRFRARGGRARLPAPGLRPRERRRNRHALQPHAGADVWRHDSRPGLVWRVPGGRHAPGRTGRGIRL